MAVCVPGNHSVPPPGSLGPEAATAACQPCLLARRVEERGASPEQGCPEKMGSYAPAASVSEAKMARPRCADASFRRLLRRKSAPVYLGWPWAVQESWVSASLGCRGAMAWRMSRAQEQHFWDLPEMEIPTAPRTVDGTAFDPEPHQLVPAHMALAPGIAAWRAWRRIAECQEHAEMPLHVARALGIVVATVPSLGGSVGQKETHAMSTSGSVPAADVFPSCR